MTSGERVEPVERTRVTLHVCVICGTAYLWSPIDICGECGTEAEAIGPVEFVASDSLSALIEKLEARARRANEEGDQSHNERAAMEQYGREDALREAASLARQLLDPPEGSST